MSALQEFKSYYGLHQGNIEHHCFKKKDKYEYNRYSQTILSCDHLGQRVLHHIYGQKFVIVVKYDTSLDEIEDRVNIKLLNYTNQKFINPHHPNQSIPEFINFPYNLNNTSDMDDKILELIDMILYMKNIPEHIKILHNLSENTHEHVCKELQSIVRGHKFIKLTKHDIDSEKPKKIKPGRYITFNDIAGIICSTFLGNTYDFVLITKSNNDNMIVVEYFNKNELMSLRDEILAVNDLVKFCGNITIKTIDE